MTVTRDEAAALLRWYVEIGVDEAASAGPVDRLAAGPVPPARRETGPSPPPSAPTPEANGRDARAAARAATTHDELMAAIHAFEGCALKRTATTTCVYDGDPAARVMIVGEAPGREEDRRGKPFVGPAGKLLDRMLAAIGLDRNGVYITNTLYWRPPGNRTPTPEEIALCLPFLERQIELIAPAVLVYAGGTAAKAMLGRTEGITRLRGRWFALALEGREPIPAIATFHPAYLLRQPGRKRESWRDLLAIRAKLDELGVAPAARLGQSPASARNRS